MIVKHSRASRAVQVRYNVTVTEVTGASCSASLRSCGLHGRRRDTDGDGSDAVADASVALATATHLLAADPDVGAGVVEL